jgi:mycothiol synthase
MHWPASAQPPKPVLPDGYILRGWKPGDDVGWLALLNANGSFGPWTAKRLSGENRTLVRSGQRFIVRDDLLVATTGVYDREIAGCPRWEIGWVAAHPAHTGRGLGKAVVGAATAAAVGLGGRPIALYTDDHRLPAICIYLELGFVPDLTTDPGYGRRWERVHAALAAHSEISG